MGSEVVFQLVGARGGGRLLLSIPRGGFLSLSLIFTMLMRTSGSKATIVLVGSLRVER